MTVKLENGNTIRINAVNNDSSKRYIKELLLNGRPYSKNYFAHEDLLRGATIDITMSETPNTKRGIQKTDAPYSFSSKEK